MKFRVSESGDFRSFTNVETNETFRVPIRDILLVLRKQGYPPAPGELIELDQEQQRQLALLHGKWERMGDEAAVHHNKVQAFLGCFSWIVLLLLIGFGIWWFFVR